VRVVVADDALLTREGIIRLLERADIEVVAQADDAASLLVAAHTHRPDIAIVDIRMPPTHTDEGLVAAERIRAELPDVGVLLLSQYVDSGYAVRLLQSYPERVGYLLKERIFGASSLVEAIRRVHDGECVIDPTIIATLVGRRRRANPLDALSIREREVLSLVAEGRSNKSIARHLGVTERTIEAHVSQTFLKLGINENPDAHRRVLAVLAFLRD
jgi:DNA-binding NarL/FixJ family response regulator